MNILSGNNGETLRSNFNKFIKIQLFKPFERLPFILSFIAFATIIYDYGFDQIFDVQRFLAHAYEVWLYSEVIFLVFRYLVPKKRPPLKVWFIDFLLFLTILITIPVITGSLDLPFFSNHYWVAFVFLWIFLRELSTQKIEFKRRYVNPAQLFMISFLFVIFVGAFVLMFPHATQNGINFVDALFTATSAVCVTGLAVVDTGTFFTPFGQTAIMVLIQLGGLGIMTFTSYFSYFFTGDSSYENQLLIQEMTNSDKITEVFGTLKKVLLVTFALEGLGAVLIFSSLDLSLLPQFKDRLFFSVFHSVSGFCNAGFSTLTNNLYEIGYRFNYPLHLTIAGLIIIGGIGFPILFNFYKYLKHICVDQLFKKNDVHIPWVININTRIVVVTTAILLIVGTVLIYFIEYNNTLAEHSAFGKIVTAFFGAVTPRTAGFNSVDNSMLHLSTVLLLYFLMWVGASPGSTGGGIKTSTLAISVLNSISIARGKDRIELYGREIADSSIRRAYSQIFLSLIVIAASVFGVAWFDPELSLRSIIFECISAFATVGLSLGITAQLSEASKYVIIVTMFVGRVSMLTVLVSFLKKVKFSKYRFPSDDILIN